MSGQRLYSLADVARVAGVSRQRVWELQEQGDLPEPLGMTRAGRIWDADVVDAWAATRNRRPGRPPTSAVVDPLWTARHALVARIGALWRSDWSGHVFDGHDGQRWLDTAMGGDVKDLAQLAMELDRIERVYG